ncbi:MAG: phosphodiester glycosidase family protein [Candidatus Saccharibacteria bacterium]
MNRFIRYIALFVICTLLLPLSPALYADEMRQLDRGVVYRHITKTAASKYPQSIHIIDINLNDPRVELKFAMPQKGLGYKETTSSIAKANHALAGINGNFFLNSKPPIPADTVTINRQIICKGPRDPAAMGILTTKKVFIDSFTPNMILSLNNPFRQFPIEAVNYPTGVGCIMYTSFYGQTTRTPKQTLEYVVLNKNGRYYIDAINHGNSNIPKGGFVLSFQGTTVNLFGNLQKGQEVFVNTYYPNGYENLNDLLACGPLLLKNGISVPIDLTFREAKLKLRNPRSAVGLTNNNHLLMVAVDGRAKGISGMTYQELTKLMRELGCRNAMALDGGGSTALYANGSIVNQPCEGKERQVANAILVISQIPVYVNGARHYFTVQPAIIGGRAYLPMDETVALLKANVSWDAATRTLSCDSGRVTAVVPLEGQPVDPQFAATPIMINGRIMLPIDFINLALGAEVHFDPATEEIWLNTLAP